MRHFRVLLFSLVFSLVALLPIPSLRAQEAGTISGVVIAKETGAAVPTARVAIPGARLAVTTGLDGRYTLTGVPPGTYRLEARLIGYELAAATDVVVTAWQTTTVDFQLERLAIALTEVVVVGYGTQARRDVTGSVASVSGADLQRSPTSNPIDAIKGRVAGVDIVSERNMPGSGVRVRVRGERSLEASNDPLYVLDGIPLSGGIGDLNPSDIESVDVLKDASATAIYGSRGANGVVLITTRQGKAGATSISYDTYAGMQQEVRRLRMMNGAEWAEHRREAYRAVGKYPCPGSDPVCGSVGGC